jgi:hypothetical protein
MSWWSIFGYFKAVFHEPHPEKETNKGAVKAVQEFLVNADIKEDY